MLSKSILKNIVNINVYTVMKAFPWNGSTLLPVLNNDILQNIWF